MNMIEIYVRCEEGAIFIQEPADIGEFVSLKLTNILKNTLGHYDVKLPVAKLDRGFEEICLDKGWEPGCVSLYQFHSSVHSSEEDASALPGRSRHPEDRIPFLVKSYLRSSQLFRVENGVLRT